MSEGSVEGGAAMRVPEGSKGALAAALGRAEEREERADSWAGTVGDCSLVGS